MFCTRQFLCCLERFIVLFKVIICGCSYRSKHRFQCIYLGCFNFTSINSRSHLFVLPSHHTSTHSPSTKRHLSYRVTTFSAPYTSQFISCIITRPVTAVYISQSSSTLWPQTFCFSDGNTTILTTIDRTATCTL